MKYSQNWLYIDIAIFISFLPFFFVLPISMQFFTLLGLFFVYKKQTKLLWISGVIFLIFTYYNIIELRNFKVYLTFLVSLLIWGVFLQRTEKLNNYLYLSPLLFFGLSIVFFQNIYMLFYAIFEIFLFLFLLLYKRLAFKPALKETAKLFLLSLPLVIVLFLFFPRYYQKNFNFGFVGNVVNTGIAKNVDTKITNIKLSKIPVVEFKLKHTYPYIYLRGKVFYYYKNGVWLENFKAPKDKIIKISKPETYYLKQYPTNEKTIYAIDLIFKSNFGKIDKHFILHSKKPIKKELFIQINSSFDYKIAPQTYPFIALQYNKNFNPNTQKLITPLLSIPKKERLNKLITLFKNQKIKYTLHPKNLDTNNIVDSLFQTKNGFCTHFSTAFAIMARMANIPSRIVSGFLVTKNINGYYKVYSKDAHSWVEVYIDGYWKRIDPTTFAYKNLSKKEFKDVEVNKLNIYISYVKFVLEEWILHYNATLQQKFFNFFKNHLFQILVGFILFLSIIGFLIIKLNEKKTILSPLYKKLKNSPKNETVYNFLKKYNDKKLDEINNLYQKITFYKNNKNDIKKLKKLIKDYNGKH